MASCSRNPRGPDAAYSRPQHRSCLAPATLAAALRWLRVRPRQWRRRSQGAARGRPRGCEANPCFRPREGVCAEPS